MRAVESHGGDKPIGLEKLSLLIRRHLFATSTVWGRPAGVVGSPLARFRRRTDSTNQPRPTTLGPRGILWSVSADYRATPHTGPRVD